MRLYYLINEDNEFLYSGQEFEGSTLLETYTLPTTSSTVTVRPYDNNIVKWDITHIPVFSDSSNIELMDLSGIELTNYVRPLSYGSKLYSCSKFVWFRGCEFISDLGNLFTSKLTSFESVEYGLNHLPDLPNCTVINSLFKDTNITTATVHSIDSCTSLSGMFMSCSSLREVYWANDWINVEIASSLFANDNLIKSIVIPTAPKLKNLYGICRGCIALTSFVNNNNIEAYYNNAFVNCSALREVNISGGASPSPGPYDGGSPGTFSNCNVLETVNVGYWFDLEYRILTECNLIEEISITIKDWRDGNSIGAHDYLKIAQSCPNLRTVTLNNTLNLMGVYNLNNMFYSCRSLTTIYCSGFYYTPSGTDVFVNCPSLVGGNGTVYDSNNIDYQYACIDGKDGQPGYFTWNEFGIPYASVVGMAGNTGMVKGSGLYGVGNQYRLTYVPSNGNTIDYWIKWNNATKQFERVGDKLIYEDTADADTIIIAIAKYSGMAEVNFSVDLSSYPEEWGTVYGGGEYLAHSPVIIRAVPASGYIFSRWEELLDGQWVVYSNSSSEIIFDLGRNMTLRAVFAEATNNPYEEQGTSGTGGGKGNYDNTSDPINDNLTSKTMGTNNGGLITVYCPTDAELNWLKSYLYSTQDGPEDILAVIQGVANKLGTAIGLTKSPVDYILNFFELPVGIDSKDKAQRGLHLGFFDTKHQFTYTNKTLLVVDMGEIEIKEYWGNSLDYDSRITIYLPYIGYNNLDARGVMGKKLHLYYNIDLYTGNCVAQIMVNGSVLYQFNGNMAYQLPLGQENYNNQMLNTIGTAVNMVGLLGG